MMFIMMAVMLVGFYFPMLRPQMKNKTGKELPGIYKNREPELFTTSGMHGKIVNVMEDGVIGENNVW